MESDSPETMRKLCLSPKFSHQEIRWNYGILHSDNINEGVEEFIFPWIDELIVVGELKLDWSK